MTDTGETKATTVKKDLSNLVVTPCASIADALNTFELRFWRVVFDMVGLSLWDHILCRSSLCRFFRIVLLPPPIHVMFPHSSFPSLSIMFERISKASRGNPNNVPIVVIGRGVHEIDTSTFFSSRTASVHIPQPCVYDKKNRCFQHYPIVIVGAGEKETIIQGSGFWFGEAEGEENSTTKENVIRDMTIQRTIGPGVKCFGSLPLKMINVTVNECGSMGVEMTGGSIAKCTNLKVSKCKFSGVAAQSNGRIILQGEETSITGNMCAGIESFTHYPEGIKNGYGIVVNGHKSIIQFVCPLSKEQVCVNNGGGGNWGTRGGKIQGIDSDGKVVTTYQTPGEEWEVGQSSEEGVEWDY